jgi:predicted Zn-dependent protease with MMP-like domain
MESFSSPPSLDDIEAIASEQLAALPSAFREHLGDIVFRVQEFPDAETLDAFEMDSPFDLMGLYHGVDIGSKSVSDPAPGIDMIYLYRRPILDYWCETGEDLGHLVRHVLIHEIGHHFGLSDDDMHAIEDGA